MILWGIYVFLVGQRQYIVGIALTTFVLAYKYQLFTIKIKDLALWGGFLLTIMLGMIYLRTIYGRDTFTNMNLSEKINSFSTTTVNNVSDLKNSFMFDLGYRLNSGNIMLGLLSDLPGVNSLWIEPVTFSTVSLIPNIFWADKAQVYHYDLPNMIGDHYGLPVTNYITTFITVFYAMGGLPALIILCGFLGIMVAFLDFRLAQNTSILSLIMDIGLGYGLLSIDHSIDLLFTALRDSFLLYLVISLSILIKRLFLKKNKKYPLRP